MLMMSVQGHLREVSQRRVACCWPLLLLIAFGCGSRTSLNRAVSSADTGAAGVGGKAEGHGGEIGSGGLSLTGGGVGSGGVASGGTTSTGGSSASGGTRGEAGTEGSGPVFGMACTTDADCPSGSTCCDGSGESCDGTRLPSGDGTNSGELVVSSDGKTVTDAITGLVWQRDGDSERAGCPAFASVWQCSWAEAESYCASLSLGGMSGWRLPALMELMTIVDPTQSNPAIDQTAFPSTPSNTFWTASPATRSYRWIVGFNDGVSDVAPTTDYFHYYQVRCVRGSRCYPKSRFLVLSGGLVQDALTNLVWQQQADTTGMTWAKARTYCSSFGDGFRLPTLKELSSLVDLTVTSGPAFNHTAFPNTSPLAAGFWTSSLYVGSSGSGWVVGIDGRVLGNPVDHYMGSVRCVR